MQGNKSVHFKTLLSCTAESFVVNITSKMDYCWILTSNGREIINGGLIKDEK
jgi:hypothetical protein